jgi:Concanavalin A-like lectin/glucanases superfamily
VRLPQRRLYGQGAYDLWLADVGPGQVGQLPDFTVQNTYDCDPTSPRTIDGASDGGVAWASVRGCPTPSANVFVQATTGATSGQVVCYYYSSGKRELVSPGSYTDGHWHLVLCAKGSGGMTLDVDGSLVASNTFTGPAFAYSGYWVIGNRHAGDGAQQSIIGDVGKWRSTATRSRRRRTPTTTRWVRVSPRRAADPSVPGRRTA